jgi:hypothetical protein
MLGFNGGLMGVRKVPTTGSASGLWFQNEQSVAKRAGIWPITRTATRYYRFANFANTSLDSDTIDLAEIRFYTGDTVISSITTTTNFSWGSGSAAALTDGDLTDRNYYSGWASSQSTATISFDFGSVTSITHVQIFIWYEVTNGPRFPASCELQSSSDGTSYTLYSSVTKGTTTLESGAVWKTAKLEL